MCQQFIGVQAAPTALLRVAHLLPSGGKRPPIAHSRQTLATRDRIFHLFESFESNPRAPSEPQATLDFTIFAAARPTRTRINIELYSPRLHASSL